MIHIACHNGWQCRPLKSYLCSNSCAAVSYTANDGCRQTLWPSTISQSTVCCRTTKHRSQSMPLHMHECHCARGTGNSLYKCNDICCVNAQPGRHPPHERGHKQSGWRRQRHRAGHRSPLWKWRSCARLWSRLWARLWTRRRSCVGAPPDTPPRSPQSVEGCRAGGPPSSRRIPPHCCCARLARLRRTLWNAARRSPPLRPDAPPACTPSCAPVDTPSCAAAAPCQRGARAPEGSTGGSRSALAAPELPGGGRGAGPLGPAPPVAAAAAGGELPSPAEPPLRARCCAAVMFSYTWLGVLLREVRCSHCSAL